MAKPPIRKPKKKSNPLKLGQDRLHRLQGHRPAAQVHLRPRQDPRPPGDRRQLASSSARSPRRSRTPARWRCCPTPRPLADTEDTIDEAHPDPRGAGPRAWPATSSRSPTATAATTWCRAARPSPGPRAPRSRSAQIKRARDAREIRDLGHAREIKAELEKLSVTLAGSRRRGRQAVRLGHRRRRRRRGQGRRRSAARQASGSSCPVTSRRSANTRSPSTCIQTCWPSCRSGRPRADATRSLHYSPYPGGSCRSAGSASSRPKRPAVTQR